MYSLFSTRPRSSFQLPLGLALIIGTGLTLAFYGLLLYGPIGDPLLNRICTHRAAEVSMWLFFIAVAGLAIQLRNMFSQRAALPAVGQVVEKFVVEGEEVAPKQRVLWLEAHWLSLPKSQRESWIGCRVAELVERQIKRGKSSMLEADMRELAESDARAQRDNYALVRLIIWALPIVGLLGTVIGISSVVGAVEGEQLASQTAVAIKQAGAGIVVAFDTTVLALGLMMALVFAQFTISRLETDLLSSLDELIRDNLVEFLNCDAPPVQQDVLSPVRQMADDLVSAVHQLVEQQSTLWTRSITEAQKQWSTWSTTSSDQLRGALCESLDKSLANHAQEIERIGQEAGRQVDSRWQQWQITLSDQARVMHGQQKELVRQTEAIERLITSTGQLKKLEDVVQENFGNVHMIQELIQASSQISHAVDVLTAGLERAGIIRGTPVKPRVNRKAVDEEVIADRITTERVSTERISTERKAA